jgi:integrase/recombinase XerD
MAETGMRRSEVVNLDIQDLRLSERMAVVRNAKGGKTRLVPLTEALIRLITDGVGDRIQGPVFLSRGNNRLSSRQVNRIVEKAGAVADVQHPDPSRSRLNCHLFRHTFARLWKDAGGSIETLSSILGHASQATTMDLYGREGLSDVRSNYAKTMKRISILTHKGELK